jgi:hypothetical protein
LSFVHRAHASGAERIQQCERTEYEALCFPLEKAVCLELAQDSLLNKELRQRRRLGSRIGLQKLADQLVELTAVDQITPP